jgi:prepilin-type N-terminal cleavage/methylation domain-containing protein
MKFERAFSLIELMVVIAIISILSVVAIANFGGITEKGKHAKALSQMDELKKAITKYTITHDGRYPRSLKELVGSDISAVPMNPWNRPYYIDEYYVICEVPQGKKDKPEIIRVPYRNPGWIYFNDGNDIKKVAAIGGPIQTVITGKNPDISLEKSFLVYSNSGIKYIDLTDDTAPEVEVSDGSSDDYPSWSPEGNRIAFVDTAAGDIYVQNIENLQDEPINVTRNIDVSFYSPSFSSDGKKLVVESADHQLWIIDVNGSVPPRQLTVDGGSYPNWSNSGNKIVFTDDNGKLSLIKSSDYRERLGSRENILDENGVEIDGDYPCWSPDDSNIVYTFGGKLFVYSFRTKKIFPVVDNKKEQVYGTTPSWGYR